MDFQVKVIYMFKPTHLLYYILFMFLFILNNLLIFLQLYCSYRRCLFIPVFILQIKENLSSQSKLGYNLSLPNTPNSVGSITPNSEDLPPYETPPPSANHSSKDQSFNDGEFIMSCLPHYCILLSSFSYSLVCLLTSHF